MNINIPRGTRDFSPDEMFKRRYVENKIRNIFQSFGYREVQTPTFEHLELFTLKSGEEIIEEIYAFKDKGNRDLALRPELTAPVIRFYVEKMQMEPKPLKLFYIGNCYRYDRPQKGRYREFTQVGCELIGTDTPEAQAELVYLAYTILKNIGLRNIVLRLGNLDIIYAFLENMGIKKNQFRELMHLIDKSRFYELEKRLFEMRVAKSKIKMFKEFLNCTSIDKLKGFIEVPAIDKFGEVIDFLKIFGIDNFEIDMKIVRGLDYYKGVVFEIDAPILGAEKQLCGGGEYELVSLFGGKEVPTAGFAIGFDRAVIALEEEGYVFPEQKIDAYVIPINEKMLKNAIKIVNRLREKNIVADVDLMRRGLAKSLKYASSIRAKKAIIVGPQEWGKESVIVRDMDSGEQIEVKIKDLLFKVK
ncbi:MAG TPA: histidine--tRNA ligase [Thermoplasmatales archaeon]|nr:histidine--tRNA ligase [Thermoplasmatales archaeon]HEX08741.1 histidine--tRNA ligase [Thermoplasmatales archaeon]